MARTPLSVGTYGKITFSVLPSGSWRARARFRDHDGVRRDVYGHGRTRSRAATDLKAKCRDRAESLEHDISATSKVSVLVDQWLSEIDDRANLAASTKEIYRDVATRHVVPALGQLRVRELSVRQCDRFVQTVSRSTGPALAKTARTVLSGACGLATRRGAMTANPTRDIARISQPKRRRPRAPTKEELQNLILALRTDPKANVDDIPDLLHFMIGTGARIGEAMAVRRSDLDLGSGTVSISATVQRIKGQGAVLQPHPDSSGGVRTLYLSEDVTTMLARRIASGETATYDGDELMFPSPLKHLRDRSNTTARLREALDRAGEQYREFSSHGFRKAVLTWLDESGVTARQAAVQAGHAKVSMTQDIYFARGSGLPEAARLLAMPALG